jgi:hypothetical protein
MFSLLLENLLFEAPVDAWLKRHGSEGVDKNHLSTLADFFKRFSAVIYNPDITAYSFDQLKTMVKVVDLCKKFLLKGTTIKWLTKQIFEDKTLTVQNVKEDFIPLLRRYEKVPGQGRKDLNDIKDVTELSHYIQDLGSGAKELVPEEHKDIIYDDGEWMVAMPHTTEASCELGAGTTWCTAMTASQNLFLSYLAAGKGIILFYVIKKGGNPRSNPDDKISVGFINGEPKFNQGRGNITVNAANDNVTEEDFGHVLGQQRAQVIIQKMIEKAQATPVHPAQKELDVVISSIENYQRKLSSFKSEAAKVNFAVTALESPSISPEVLTYILTQPGVLEDSEFSDSIRVVSLNTQKPENINALIDILVKDSQEEIWRYRKFLENTHITADNFKYLVKKLAQLPNPLRAVEDAMTMAHVFYGFSTKEKGEIIDVLVELIPQNIVNNERFFTWMESSKSSGMFTEQLQELFAKSTNPKILQDLAYRTESPRIMALLTQTTDFVTFLWLTMNPKLPQEIFLSLLQKAAKDINSENPENIEALEVLLTRKNKITRSYLELFAKSTNEKIRTVAQGQLAKGAYIQESKRLLTNLLFGN